MISRESATLVKHTGSRKLPERSAAEDLWRNTLCQIPSIFGRLVYLSALRDQNTGRYEHHGLGLIYGEEETNRALRKYHSQAFSEWLSYDLEQQKADLDLYLSALFEDKKSVLETWMRLTPHRNVVPASARGVDKRLYIADFRAILELLRNEYGVSDPDPDA